MVLVLVVSEKRFLFHNHEDTSFPVNVIKYQDWIGIDRVLTRLKPYLVIPILNGILSNHAPRNGSRKGGQCEQGWFEILHLQATSIKGVTRENKALANITSLSYQSLNACLVIFLAGSSPTKGAKVNAVGLKYCICRAERGGSKWHKGGVKLIHCGLP